jgi:hypothetical protein
MKPTLSISMTLLCLGQNHYYVRPERNRQEVWPGQTYADVFEENYQRSFRAEDSSHYQAHVGFSLWSDESANFPMTSVSAQTGLADFHGSFLMKTGFKKLSHFFTCRKRAALHY